MSLLTTAEAKNIIAEQTSLATQHLQIVSAFCKTTALEFIDTNIKKPISDKKILVRFLLSDLISGATDFDLYDYCKANGWKLFIRFDLHAKTYIFDRKRCVLGSANLTSSGMGINFHGNYELSCFADVDEADIQKVDTLFDNAILVTNELYEVMKRDYEKAQENKASSEKAPRWSVAIERKFNPPTDVLFTFDFPTISSPDMSDVNCFEFLEFKQLPSKEELKQAFRWSKAFLWLYNILSKAPEQTMYFGAVTAELHNMLINDPKPYRKEVKELLSNLLGWIQALGMDEISIDVPNHSQRIRITK